MSATNIGTFNGIGPLGNTANFAPNPAVGLIKTSEMIPQVISLIIGIMTVFAGIWFIFQIFIGAINWLSSGGDKQGVDNAKKRLTNAIIGLAIVVFSYSIIDIVGRVLGLPILSLSPAFIRLRP